MKYICIMAIIVLFICSVAYADMWIPEKSHNLQLAQEYITSEILMTEAMLDELFDVYVYEEPENHLWEGMFICNNIPENPYGSKVGFQSIKKKPGFTVTIKNDQVIECQPELSNIIGDIREYLQFITEYNALCKASEYWEYVWNSEWIFWSPEQKADFYHLYHRNPYQIDFSYTQIYVYPPTTTDQNEVYRKALQFVDDLQLDPDKRCELTGMDYTSNEENSIWGITGYEFVNEYWQVVYVIALNDNYELVNYYARNSSGELTIHKAIE